MNRNEIRKKIYHLAKVTDSKRFRKLFPEFANYSLQTKMDLKAILDCLEVESEAVAAVIVNTHVNCKVVSLPEYKFNKQLAACQNSEDYIDLMSDLTQEIISDCKKYAQYFRSKML